MMDLVLRLREARRLANLTQAEAARKSGVGAKTICSFETGARIDSMKHTQLEKLLSAYGLTREEFFSDNFERRVISQRMIEDVSGIQRLVDAVGGISDDDRRKRLIQSFLGMVDLTRQSEHRGRRLV